MVTGYNEQIRLRATAESNQANCPLKLTIVKGVGDNTASTIYLDNKALAWPNDIRFTNEAGTELSFWREESDATDGTWWVQVDSLTANVVSYIYLHYGKAGDSDADSGPDGIITFYDDFETGDLSKWTSVGTDWTAQDTTKYEGNYAAQSIGSSMSYDLYKDITPGCSVAIEAKVRVNKAIHQFNPFKLTLGTHSLNALFLNAGNFDYKLATHLPDTPRYNINTWYPIKIIIDNASQVLRWEISGAWNVDADPYTEQVALVDNSGNAIGASDFLTRIAADWHTASDSDDYGYIDYFIIYPYGGAKWLSPETTEILEDGLYVVERSTDVSLKPEETMRVMAYNDYDLEFIISKFNRPYDYSAGGGYAWTYTYVITPDMLLEDTKHGVAAHYTDGELKCTFENTETDDGKTIVDVTIAAFVSGRARTILTYDGVDYYGTLSTKKHVAAWLETVYTTIPGTSDPWTFSALGVFSVAGVDLRKTSSATFPITFGSESELYSPTDDWDTDPSMYFLDTTCYSIKLLVHYYLNSDPSTILELEMFPESPLDYETRLSAVHINPINNGDRPGSPAFGIVADVEDMPTHTYYVFAKFDPTYLSYVDGGAVKLALGLADWGYPPYLNWKYRAYVQLNGTKYYKSWVTGESVSTTPIVWATNPATSAAWADGDLIAGDGCGVEIHDLYESCSPPTHYMIYPNLGALYPIITTSGNVDYYTLYGDLECTPSLWRVTPGGFHNFYLYYASAPSECTLVGDMYLYDNVDITSDELYKRMESDLSELPPSFSQINGFKVTASVFAWSDDTANTYWRIFVNVDGTRYYSDEYTTVGHPNLAKTQTYSWDTNPATSAAWNYDDFQGIKYGVEVTRADKYDLVIFRPYALYADIDYQAIVGPKAVIYHQIPAIESSVSLTKNSNTPKFKADELRCVLPVGFYLPERAEIVYSQDGAHVFHGFIWQADQRPNKETKILAKAQSHALACRYIPNFFYHARNGRWASVFSLSDLFSDGVPIYPNEFGWMSYGSNDDEYQRWIFDGEGPFLDSPPNYPQIYQLWGIYNNIGIFFILNSMIPYGYTGDTGRYRDVAGLSYNRSKFLLSHNPSTIPKVENVGRCIIDRSYVYHLTPWTEETGTWDDEDPIYVPDWVGSVKRFRQGNPASLSIDEYAYSGHDVLVAHNPGVFMVLFDHALDTYLRPGRFELEDKFLAVPYLFDGAYSDAFSDFFFRLGQEVRFRNSSNGYVYMDVASDLGNAAYLKFIDGKNATVTKSVRDPQPAAVLGNEFQPGLSTDWVPALTWLTQIEPTRRSGEDLQEWLDLRRDEDKSTWTIKTKDKLWHILPGDHVFAQAHGQGLEDVRVRKAVISNTGTTLTCGKRISDLSEEWGQWQSVKGSTDADTDMPVQVQEIDFDNCDDSQTFVIKAEEYEIGSWKCKLTVDWALDIDEGYTADIASAPLGMFLVAKVESKVVPPGRILSKGNSGSVEIDITNFCTCSTSTDQTNTVALKLWRGVTSTNYRHKISGNITQYRRLEAVSNA